MGLFFSLLAQHTGLDKIDVVPMTKLQAYLHSIFKIFEHWIVFEYLNMESYLHVATTATVFHHENCMLKTWNVFHDDDIMSLGAFDTTAIPYLRHSIQQSTLD